jgi:hypothetical protein
MRARLSAPVEQVVQEINLFLRGWAAVLPIRELRSRLRRDQTLRADAACRVHRQAAPTRAGLGVSPRSTGHRPTSVLFPSMASSSHPGPIGPAGSGRTPSVKGVGEPCAGEPHARFDGRGLETERGFASPRQSSTQPSSAAAKHPDPVAAAQRPDTPLAKASRKHTEENHPVHNFTSLLADLATICANHIQPTDDMPALTMITTPDSTTAAGLPTA